MEFLPTDKSILSLARPYLLILVHSSLLSSQVCTCNLLIYRFSVLIFLIDRYSMSSVGTPYAPVFQSYSPPPVPTLPEKPRDAKKVATTSKRPVAGLSWCRDCLLRVTRCPWQPQAFHETYSRRHCSGSFALIDAHDFILFAVIVVSNTRLLRKYYFVFGNISLPIEFGYVSAKLQYPIFRL